MRVIKEHLMPHYKFRNVNDAFRTLVKDIHEGVLPTEVQPSRYGEVVRVTEPIIVTYSHPWECVLLNRARDANPFFAMYEALWMLVGRNDVAPLVYYNRRMAEFSDNGVRFNGAYGYRWRHATLAEPKTDYAWVNQLDVIVKHLKEKPESRRAVLQMWTVEDDLLKIDTSKDMCCNVCVFFEVESGTCRHCGGSGGVCSVHTNRFHPCARCNGNPHDVPRYLNMTVINRSNDLVWGMLGANAVQFPFLQAYMAGRLGLDVGVYHQVTNNLHAYTKNWKPLEWLAEPEEEYPGIGMSLIRDAMVFEEELPVFVDEFSGGVIDTSDVGYLEPFLEETASRMCLAHYHYKNVDYEAALSCMDGVESPDWWEAGRRWLERRIAKRSKA